MARNVEAQSRSLRQTPFIITIITYHGNLLLVFPFFPVVCVCYEDGRKVFLPFSHSV